MNAIPAHGTTYERDLGLLKDGVEDKLLKAKESLHARLQVNSSDFAIIT